MDLVTGATGYVGGRLLERLLREGRPVRAMAREGASALDDPVSRHMTERVITTTEDATIPDTMELMTEPSFTERGILQIAEHPTGPFKMPSWPVRFDGRPPKLEPAPLLGQHNAQVLGDWLGMSSGDVEGLKKEGVI